MRHAAFGKALSMSNWATTVQVGNPAGSSPLCVGSNHNNDFLTVVNILATLQQLQIPLTNSLAHKLY